MSDTPAILVATHGRLAQLLGITHKLWYFERATAHVLSGWAPKFHEYAQKTGCAHVLAGCANTATSLERCLGAFETATTLRLMVPPAWIELMEAVDRSPDAPALFGALLGQLEPRLLGAYDEALALADELLHESLRAALVQGRQALLDRATRLPWWTDDGRPCGLQPAIEAAWHTAPAPRPAGAPLLWEPIDRVPHAARPASAIVMAPGSMRLLPLDGLDDPAGIGLVLHNNINGEYTTMELMCRCAYEHPEMPSAFHLDMARHGADEARHALAMERMAARYGVRFGDHPVSTYTYDAIYQFEPCQAGSADELLWRLLLRATVQEGDSLDDLAYQAKKRTFLGQDELAAMFAAILADEIFHVRSGLKWSRLLCERLGRDELQEREATRRFYDNGLLLRRARFVRANPELAAAERNATAHREAYRTAAGLEVPFGRDFNQSAREFAGFSPADLAQARRWEVAV
jgi:uncharacterized ferritin-like protein (DUF455 family)